ncbi:hypothetical protein SAMN00120144_1172 [Hymenobacter roseosalivarius DSM 11622]|uniref:HPt domain-containing protein n=1 Tax=Hymenobacter roseosalivarius DSM 11622 TaxID=645990 RepID=A0A1W1V4D1_9BACT|nr:hypothetical protein [Hymenobacter roseosalivarius]SMB88143.1 hypothetical protein SAMN00120144_1172 [Hymenobacter roseosalivarius DSM 11622]
MKQPNAPQSGADLLAGTVHALQGGLTSLPLSTAHTNIDTWQETLQQSGIPELQDIDRELGNLQSLLSDANGIDGEAVGQSLDILGTQTLQAAAHATPDAQTALRALGDLLLQHGAKLK